MDDPYKLPLPTIPHKTMVVHGTPRSALPPLPKPPMGVPAWEQLLP